MSRAAPNAVMSTRRDKGMDIVNGERRKYGMRRAMGSAGEIPRQRENALDLRHVEILIASDHDDGHSGGARADDIDLVDVADVERALGCRSHRAARMVEDPRVGLLDA